jgi:hypothetical protein
MNIYQNTSFYHNSVAIKKNRYTHVDFTIKNKSNDFFCCGVTYRSEAWEHFETDLVIVKFKTNYMGALIYCWDQSINSFYNFDIKNLPVSILMSEML